jgi:Mn-containing catalase
MYHHVKKLMYTVRIGTPDPRFGNMLLEQFGGANGELAAAMQYSIQGLNCDDPYRKDLLMDIGTEELSHLEVVGVLTRMHLKPLKTKRHAAEADPLISIVGGGGVNLYNSMGSAWTADYLKVSGEIDVDLRSNIAAEARAKITYERLINFTDDQGTIDALQFLMTREITHMKAFTAALESLGKPAFSMAPVFDRRSTSDVPLNSNRPLASRSSSEISTASTSLRRTCNLSPAEMSVATSVHPDGSPKRVSTSAKVNPSVAMPSTVNARETHE